MADKTYPQLTQATDIQPGDLLATYRQSTSGPLKGFLYDTLLTTLATYFGGTYLKTANLLSEIQVAGASALSQARSNLGLGGAATLSVGQAVGTVAAGDDSRITGALQTAGGAITGPTTLLTNPVARVAQTGTVTVNTGRITISTAAAPTTLAPGEIWLQTS